MIIKLEQVDSTNSYIRRRIDTLPHGVLVLSHVQSGGRGRGGHSWLSPCGGLYMSLLARPYDESRPGHLSVAAAIAVYDALIGFHRSLVLSLKWPNDILVHGGKLCGILCECTHGAAIIGVGVNLFPVEDGDGMASLARLGVEPLAPERYARAIRDSFFDAYALSGDMLTDRYRALCGTLGRMVDIHDGASVKRGTAVGVDGEGMLVVECGGRLVTAYSGSIRYVNSEETEAGNHEDMA